MIAILCAHVKKDETGRWVSTGWEDSDFDHGMPGGKMRNIAVSHLAKKDPNEAVFVPGGRGHDIVGDTSDRPDLSDIVKSELVELGVPAGKIITEHRSNTTFEQLQVLSDSLQKNKKHDATIVTSDFHRERVRAMIDYFPQLESLRREAIKLLAAENILVESDRNRWEPLIAAFYANPKMTEIISREKKSIPQIQSGEYKI